MLIIIEYISRLKMAIMSPGDRIKDHPRLRHCYLAYDCIVLKTQYLKDCPIACLVSLFFSIPSNFIFLLKASLSSDLF